MVSESLCCRVGGAVKLCIPNWKLAVVLVLNRELAVTVKRLVSPEQVGVVMEPASAVHVMVPKTRGIVWAVLMLLLQRRVCGNFTTILAVLSSAFVGSMVTSILVLVLLTVLGEKVMEQDSAVPGCSCTPPKLG